MPEGPSIVILREQVVAFTGRTILRAEGNAKIAMDRIAGQKVRAFRSWGKHFLIEMPDLAVRAHLGETDRRTFFCGHCQRLYASPAAAQAAAKALRSASKTRTPR